MYIVDITGTKVGTLLRYNMVSNKDMLGTHTRTHTHTHTHTSIGFVLLKSPGKDKSVLHIQQALKMPTQG